MSEVRLLKRIATWQRNKQGFANNITFEEQLLNDIESLLNSKQGNVLIDTYMGLPDLQSQFQSHGMPDLEALTSQIRYQITEFEPRLTQFSLTFNEDHQDISCFIWKLQGEASGKNITRDIIANIKIYSNGQIIVDPTV